MKLFYGTLIFLFTSLMQAWAQGHDIRIAINGYNPDEILIGYHFGNTQYIYDTLQVQSDGKFHLRGEEPMAPGVYLIIVQPDNRFVEFLVDQDQSFQIEFNVDEPMASFMSPGSEDNEAFYKYLRYISHEQKAVKALTDQIQELDSTQTVRGIQLESKLDLLRNKIRTEQLRIVDESPDAFIAQLIGANINPEPPKYEGTEDERRFKIWNYYREHYFDRFSINDRRLLRSPILLPRLEAYLERFTVQHPDSIIRTADSVLARISDPEIFKYAISAMVNRYAKSDIIGMDAVFVHLVDNYYAKGRAPWISEENLAKLKKSAGRIRKILIGKTAPDIEVYQQDKTPIRLSSIKSDYTILYFWSPKCPHCQKSIPGLKEFYKKYKPRGVEIVAVCTKTGKEEASCWDFVDKEGMDIWINTSDPTLKSRFPILYDVRSTPQVFILDKDKKILMKRIASDRLSEIMDVLMTREMVEQK